MTRNNLSDFANSMNVSVCVLVGGNVGLTCVLVGGNVGLTCVLVSGNVGLTCVLVGGNVGLTWLGSRHWPSSTDEQMNKSTDALFHKSSLVSA